MHFSETTRPDNDPQSLWKLQLELLAEAERLLGPRDGSLLLCQPNFAVNGPHIRHTPMRDGVFAELSPNAAGFWPTAVLELAHETVHLLNPVAGAAKYFEEGVAVEFSLHVADSWNLQDGVPHPLPTGYADALRLVSSLSGGTFSVAANVRESVVALDAVTTEILALLCPGTHQSTLSHLTQRFPGRG